MSRAHSVNRGRRSRRLEIEPLEDRIVPALTPVTTDLWDVNQGNVVTANSAVIGPPIYPSVPFLSNIRNMFGNVQPGVVEPSNTLFQDFEAPGSVDFVEWQTPSAMTLRSFHLIAAHDGPPRNFNHRGFNKFTLYAQNPTTLAFEKIFEISPSSLYGNTPAPSNGYLDVTPGGNVLRLSANLTPIVAQKFRAEFVQQGIGSTESGVRILELDGFDTFDSAGPIPNVSPTANAGGPYSVPEGGSVLLNGSASSDPDGTIATYQWDLNYVAPNFDIDATGVAPSFSAAGLNGPSSRTVALRVIDNLGAVSAVSMATISITNVPPSGAADNATVTVNEGATASNSGTFSDPADPVSLSASLGTVIDTGGGTWSWSWGTSDGPDDSQMVTIFGDDGEGAVPIATFGLIVNNIAPNGTADNAAETVNEGATASNSGTFSDPADPVSLSASLGTVIDTGGGTWSWSWGTSDGPDDSQTVTIFGNDGDGAVPIATFGLIVNNVAPNGTADNATVTVNEGTTASNTGTHGDPADPVSLFASVGTVIDTGGGNWNWSFNTGGAVSQTVTIFGDDGAGAMPIASFSLVINNATTVQLHINPPQINLNGNGVFQVVALSTPAFLATSLDPATLRLSGAAPIHVVFSDFDHDGDLDLVMHFRRQDFVDEYAAALSEDLEDGILNSIHQEIYLSFMGTTFSGIDVTGAAWVDMFMTGKYLDNLI